MGFDANRHPTTDAGRERRVTQSWLHQKRKLKAIMLTKKFNKAAVRKNKNHHPKVKRMLLMKDGLWYVVW